MANNKRPLDKFRVKAAGGQRIVKSGFNPGRNASWDWNELLTTIEKNFEGEFDLGKLQSEVESNTAKGATNAGLITANSSGRSAQQSLIDAQAAKLTKLCACLSTAINASRNAALINAWKACDTGC
tara:strand:- start:225 stop:602 length:378 start_codon:yes stop_codon:yes gene_type:complete